MTADDNLSAVDHLPRDIAASQKLGENSFCLVLQPPSQMSDLLGLLSRGVVIHSPQLGRVDGMVSKVGLK